MKKIFALFLAVLVVSIASPVFAVTIGVESGGIVVNSYNTATSGAETDPWLINETMTAAGTLNFEAVVEQDQTALGDDNPTGTLHSYGKWFEKTVLNNTSETWTSFELELQLILGTPSSDGDGLSFAQGGGLTFLSNVFTTYTRIDDTRDYLNFSGGSVLPGESVNFLFAITDVGHERFYLLQTPNKVDTVVPEPSTMLLVGAGLAGLAVLRRRSSM